MARYLSPMRNSLGKNQSMHLSAVNRVPQIVLTYWAIKIAATTLGETGADLLSMTLNLGYASVSLIFIGIFVLLLVPKLLIKRYDPALYWLVFTATSLAGTAMCDFMDRSLGLGYATGAVVLICVLLVILAIWRVLERSLSVERITTTRAEVLYWVAFLFANTLGTAVGDFLSDDLGFGFAGGVGFISALLLITTLLYYRTKTSRVLLFWVAFVLTRPFGATFGDFLTKSIEDGGLNLSTAGSSLLFGAVVVLLVLKEHKALQMARKQRTMATENVPTE